MYCSKYAVVLWVLALVSLRVAADENSHVYTPGEEVKVYANKMGPFNNPLETYAFFELPGCPPASWEHKFPSLGQALAGDELYKMNMRITFMGESYRETVCVFKPARQEISKWVQMIRDQYWYQLHVDDLPMWGTLGKFDGTAHIYTHMNFSLGYNGDRIVIANLTNQNLQEVGEGLTYTFTYGVSWTPSSVSFDQRFRRYLDESFFEHRVHWISVINSFTMVVFLLAIVFLILNRTLRADYARYSREPDDAMRPGAEDWVEDSGWKQLHGDVFRVPSYPTLFCAIIGSGWQLVVLSFSIIILAIANSVYTSAGTLLSYSVLAYAVTSLFAGYFSAEQFARYTAISPSIARGWIRCMLLAAALFPGTVLLLGFLLNFVAVLYDSAQAIPIGGMAVMLLLWALVSLPLVVVGTVLGRHSSNAVASVQNRNDIVRVNQIPRLIPSRPVYLSRPFLVGVGGLVPYATIFIELYFIFTSFWNYKLYYVYGFMMLVYAILLVVTGCVAVVFCYFQLNSEDHCWPWTSFFLGASTSIYVFLYSVYFYFFKTKMTGFFMFAFYYTYTAMICFGLSILCGTVAFVSASLFVRRIFQNIKVD